MIEKITMKQEDYEKILAHARACVPEEACGLIAGKDQESGSGIVRVIEQVYLLENTDHSNEHFTLSPQDQLKAVKDMRTNGWKPLGNWHSHPESPSRPSEEDKRLAYDSNASYMILSLMNADDPVLNSFHIEGTDAAKETLEIIS